jgi:hypothetical protein
MGKGDDDDVKELEERAAILRRRALFVASAIASLSVPTACADAPPGACLDVAIPEPPVGSVTAAPSADAGAPPRKTTAEPTVCLEVAAPTACLDMPMPSSGPPPGVCLKMRPPPPPPPPAPTVCLEAPFRKPGGASKPDQG